MEVVNKSVLESALKNFVQCLADYFSDENIAEQINAGSFIVGILLFNRLLDKKRVNGNDAIINAFDDFYNANAAFMDSMSIDDLTDDGVIRYSERIYIDIKSILSDKAIDTDSIVMIWKHMYIIYGRLGENKHDERQAAHAHELYASLESTMAPVPVADDDIVNIEPPPPSNVPQMEPPNIAGMFSGMMGGGGAGGMGGMGGGLGNILSSCMQSMGGGADPMADPGDPENSGILEHAQQLQNMLGGVMTGTISTKDMVGNIKSLINNTLDTQSENIDGVDPEETKKIANIKENVSMLFTSMENILASVKQGGGSDIASPSTDNSRADVRRQRMQKKLKNK